MRQAGYKEEGEVKCRNRVLEDWKSSPPIDGRKDTSLIGMCYLCVKEMCEIDVGRPGLESRLCHFLDASPWLSCSLLVMLLLSTFYGIGTNQRNGYFFRQC